MQTNTYLGQRLILKTKVVMHACILAFEENYTDKAKNTKVGHAQRIFNENKNLEALEIIATSSRVDIQTLQRAREILKEKRR